MGRRHALVASLLVGCGFTAPGIGRDGGPIDASDARDAGGSGDATADATADAATGAAYFAYVIGETVRIKCIMFGLELLLKGDKDV